MTVEPKDHLDRAIDEALSLMGSGEPQRVNAASVRSALLERRTSKIPVWLALAAVLLVGMVVGVRQGGWGRGTTGRTSSGNSVAANPRPAPSPEEVRFAEAMTRKDVHRVRSQFAADTGDDLGLGLGPGLGLGNEGLPRLTIATIDKPVLLVTPPIDAEALQIARIEIPPLSVSAISNQQEH